VLRYPLNHQVKFHALPTVAFTTGHPCSRMYAISEGYTAMLHAISRTRIIILQYAAFFRFIQHLAYRYQICAELYKNVSQSNKLCVYGMYRCTCIYDVQIVYLMYRGNSRFVQEEFRGTPLVLAACNAMYPLFLFAYQATPSPLLLGVVCCL